MQMFNIPAIFEIYFLLQNQLLNVPTKLYFLSLYAGILPALKDKSSENATNTISSPIQALQQEHEERKPEVSSILFTFYLFIDSGLKILVPFRMKLHFTAIEVYM
jgi:hypothetical protein